ncbi:TraR/DksA family transcriptional regulator [Rubrivivax rivuli]|uniref:Molecular chaperone DnaK n=1 Tax=Rubrivivax rivuli TaxID=1862385 RepID=A0A437RHK1_9BURK|nr:TraR/DksA C4-type zinc finger protein [Rubrivivax rivuli]RVU46253.1 molecular chaperone DnaK [Rubrivivax rivuli]
MSPTLTAGQHAWLQAMLKQRQHTLEAQLSSHLHGLSAAERAAEVLAQDGDDAPQRLPERDIAAALTAAEQRELQATGAALQRLTQGAYGLCSDCGTTIPFDRLKVEPSALRCVPCESTHEAARGSRA